MINLSIKDAQRISREVKKEDFSNLTPERAEEIVVAAGKFIELAITSAAGLGGLETDGSELIKMKNNDPKKYADTLKGYSEIGAKVVSSLGIDKTILSTKSVKEDTFITALAKLARGRLQSVGDNYIVETSSYNVKFTMSESPKSSYETDDIRRLAGYDEDALKNCFDNFIDAKLRDCFKIPVAAINSDSIDNHILQGDLPSTVCTTKVVPTILISVSRKEDKE